MANIQKTQEHKARLTIDLPLELHRLIKARAGLSGVSMKDFTIDALKEHLHEDESKCEFGYGHEPNQETVRILRESREDYKNGKLKSFNSVEDAFAYLNQKVTKAK